MSIINYISPTIKWTNKFGEKPVFNGSVNVRKRHSPELLLAAAFDEFKFRPNNIIGLFYVLVLSLKWAPLFHLVSPIPIDRVNKDNLLNQSFIKNSNLNSFAKYHSCISQRTWHKIHLIENLAYKKSCIFYRIAGYETNNVDEFWSECFDVRNFMRMILCGLIFHLLLSIGDLKTSRIL